MGDGINATENEMCASVSPDGKYLFFSREVDGNRDIYWVDAKVIDEYRPKE
jgi:Tol biopolymer transport system component